MKHCTKCGELKPFEAFGKRQASKDGLQHRCKQCQKMWQDDNRISRRDSWRAFARRKRLEKYGITSDDFVKLLESQEHKCKICQIPFGVYGKAGDACCVDHCHTTGVVRGLLCSNCNNGLGRFKDNPVALARATLYIQGQL